MCAVQDVLKDLVKMCDNQDGSRQVQQVIKASTPQQVSVPCITRKSFTALLSVLNCFSSHPSLIVA